MLGFNLQSEIDCPHRRSAQPIGAGRAAAIPHNPLALLVSEPA